MVACNVGVVAFTPYDTSSKFLDGSKPFLTLKHDLGESLPCVNHGEKFQGVMLVHPVPVMETPAAHWGVKFAARNLSLHLTAI
ncbi:unnamed protein product [Sphagnum troendelagicum]|uniref:Uncharacterized protein n=1 Tax=Sphagnum troendelagicum TaxID=128251 RepID=A0ABP0TB66_9BRYO